MRGCILAPTHHTPVASTIPCYRLQVEEEALVAAAAEAKRLAAEIKKQKRLAKLKKK